jgi:hypothetical protein
MDTDTTTIDTTTDTTVYNPDGTVKTERITDESIAPGYSMDAQSIDGGRRHKGSKKMHKGKRHGNASLRAWVTFVKKVQREEKVSYKEAMMRAKQRKDKGEKWRGGGDGNDADFGSMPGYEDPDSVLTGGRRRRRRTQRRSRSRSRSRSHKRSRSHRRSRRHH